MIKYYNEEGYKGLIIGEIDLNPRGSCHTSCLLGYQENPYERILHLMYMYFCFRRKQTPFHNGRRFQFMLYDDILYHIKKFFKRKKASQ